MSDRVQFDEQDDAGTIPALRPDPPTFEKALFSARIAASPGEAGILLAIAAVALIGVAFYLLASAVTPPPELGPDRLAPGESVPEYAR